MQAQQHLRQLVVQALRAEDLEGEAEAEYGLTGARGLLTSAQSAGMTVRSSRSVVGGPSMTLASATSRPSDLASISGESHSPVPSLAPATSLAATRRGQPTLPLCF